MFHSHELKGPIVPVQDYLILRPIRQDEIVKGILIPDGMQNYGMCPVVAAGPKCQLKKGDIVYIQKFVEGEFKFTLDDVLVYAIRERHVNVAINKKGPVKLKAVGNRILVRRIEEKEERRGLIFIPQMASEKTQRCEILSLGNGMDKGVPIPFEVTVGSTVLIAKYAGSDVRIDDDHYTIINENDIVATLPAAKKKR